MYVCVCVIRCYVKGNVEKNLQRKKILQKCGCLISQNLQVLYLLQSAWYYKEVLTRGGEQEKWGKTAWKDWSLGKKKKKELLAGRNEEKVNEAGIQPGDSHVEAVGWRQPNPGAN